MGEEEGLSQARSRQPIVIPDLANGATLTEVQTEGVRWLLEHDNSIFALSMGLGKTLCTLSAISVRASKRAPGAPYLVLVCLRSMSQASNWKADIAAHLKPDSFAIHDCVSDDARVPVDPSKPTVVFTTLSRLLRCFKEAAKRLPAGVVEDPPKKRTRKFSGPNNKPQPTGAEVSLMKAILSTQGLELRSDPNSKTEAGDEGENNNAEGDDEDDDGEEEEEVPKKRKKASGHTGWKLLDHDLSTLRGRAHAFKHQYWKDRVESGTLMPKTALCDNGSLFGVRWDEVHIDEAHDLRTKDSRTFRAALFLSTRVRSWITGTPMQNGARDVASATLWLRVREVCNELPVTELASMRPEPLRALPDHLYRAVRALSTCMYRRTTSELIATCPEKLANDPRMCYLVKNKFVDGVISRKFATKEEKAAHDKYAMELKGVAERLMLAAKNKKNGRQSDDTQEFEEEEEDEGGPEADDEVRIAGKRNGDNLLRAYIRALQTCVGASVISGTNEYDGIEAHATKSTKIMMVLDYMRDFVRPDEKVIIFDRRVRVLNLVARALAVSGYKSALFHGQIQASQRDAQIAQWKNPTSDVRILLSQLTMGGVGHNWTAANHVIMVAPDFNPGATGQAGDRCWRMGQTRDCKFVTLIITGSVEELVYDIHETKKRQTTAAMQAGEGKKKNTLVALSASNVYQSITQLLGGHTTYQERNTLVNSEEIKAWRERFEPPSWADAVAFAKRLPVFLDAGRCYSEAHFLPQGTLLLSVLSSTTHGRIARNYQDLRNRQHFSVMEFSRDRKRRSGSVLEVTPEPGVMPYGVALCPSSLRAMMNKEFYDVLQQWGNTYHTRVSVMGRFGCKTNTRVTDPLSIGPAYDNMKRTLAGPRAPYMVASYDFQQLDTPSEVALAHREYFAPYLNLIILRKARSKDTDLHGTYDYQSAAGHPLALVKQCALSEQEEQRTLRLDVDVLLAWSCAWSNKHCQRALTDGKPYLMPPVGDVSETWVSVSMLDLPSENCILKGKPGFRLATIKSVLLPLLLESTSDKCGGSSSNVRAMTTAVVCLYAQAGSSTTRLHLYVARDKAGVIAGIAIAAQPTDESVMCPSVYMRDPQQMSTEGALLDLLLKKTMGPSVRYVWSASDNFGRRIEALPGWSRKPRDPSCTDWSNYARGYGNFAKSIIE